MAGEQELINVIQGLDVKTILATLVFQKVTDYSGVELGKVKQYIQDRMNEKKYAFVPDPKEAIKLRQTFDTPDYKKVSELLPNFRELDLISTGLLIREYQEDGSNASKKRISTIKGEICQRSNYKHQIKVVNFPTTGHFATVIDYLSKLRDKGYTQNQIEDEFNRILAEWENTTLFVDGEKHSQAFVREWILERIKEKNSVFFVLGINSQANKIERVLADFERDNILKKNGYDSIQRTTNSGENDQKIKKIEVTIFKK